MRPAALARLHAACFTVPRPWTAAEFAALLADPAIFLCARPGGAALGRVAADEAELLTIAVAPTARRQGLGRALLAKIVAQAAGRGAARLFLEVAADNAPAITLYRAAGFAEAGRRRCYYAQAGGAPVDAIVMVRGNLA